MNKAHEKGSARLAVLLSEATGLNWVVDLGYTDGEAVTVEEGHTGDWRTRLAVTRDRWKTVRLNPNHPEQLQRKKVGVFSGKGWQEPAVSALVLAIRSSAHASPSGDGT